MKKAFTMIELVFVIVILGILSAVAIPRLMGTVVQAQITKGRADVSSIRSAIMTQRQSQLIMGINTFIAPGDGAGLLDNGKLFAGVLTYGIVAKDSAGNWHTRATVDANTSTVKYKVSETDVIFTYTRGNGAFTCSKTTGSTLAREYCADMTD